MLHSVRYLQSQWNARSPELTLKDLVDLLRPATSQAVIERARRHYQACRFQCFVKGVAVAVDGPLPNTGALFLGTQDCPDFVVGSVRPCLVLAISELPNDGSVNVEAELERQVLTALRAGLAVYCRDLPDGGKWSERLRRLAIADRFPIFDITVHGDMGKDITRPLALREVVVRVTPLPAVATTTPRPSSVH